MRTFQQRSAPLLIFIFIFHLTACSSPRPHWKLTDKAWGNPADFLTEIEGDSQTLSDPELKTLVENRLLMNPNLGSRRPWVSVSNGIVTLTGKVDSLRAKLSIEDHIRSISAIQGIKNLTQVVTHSFRRDPQLKRDAQLALALNSDLVGNSIDVYTHQGVIYLTGSVNQDSQKKLAEQIVALGRGPFVIKNYIRIN